MLTVHYTVATRSATDYGVAVMRNADHAMARADRLAKKPGVIWVAIYWNVGQLIQTYRAGLRSSSRNKHVPRKA